MGVRGRPIVRELSYYPLNTNLFDAPEALGLEEEFGAEGLLIAIKLWARTYGVEGYYLRWDPLAKKAFKRRYAPKCSNLDDIISRLVEYDWFDLQLLEKYRVLTSKAIQRRYFQAKSTNKGIEVIKEFLLVSEDSLPSDFTIKYLNKKTDNYTSGVLNDQTNTSEEDLSGNNNQFNTDCSDLSSTGNTEESDLSGDDVGEKYVYIRNEINEVYKKKEKENTDSNSENSRPVYFATLILKDNSEYHISSQELDEYCELFPNVDVRHELKLMEAWTKDPSNSRKRKTKRGTPKFIRGWLGRNHNNYQSNNKPVERPGSVGWTESGWNPV